MNIAQFLFGASPKQERWSPGTQSPEQEAILRQLLASFEQEGLTAGGATPFGGDMVAPLGDLEGLSLEALEQKILQRVQGTGPEADAQTALSKILQTGGAPTDFEGYFQKAIRDPAVQDYSEVILPELTRRYGSSGAFGSDRKLAEQQATERLGRTLAGTRSELAFRTQESAQERVLKALGLAPGIETSSTESLLKLMQGAALPRSIEQARLTSEYGEFQRQETQKQKRIEQILAALGLKTKENIATGLPGSEGVVSKVATAFAGGAGSATGGFFSDRRLKSDIVLIGLLPSGLNLYRFRYKLDPRELRFGVMADEVEEIMPAAVIVRDDGMKLVDYTMLSELGLL